jgi:hypothetical protein
LMTKPRATKLLMIMERLSSWAMANIRTISATRGEMHCIEHKRILMDLPLLPPWAVLTNLRYLKTDRACLSSPKMIMCSKREQISLVAMDSLLGHLKLVNPNSIKKKDGTKTWMENTNKHLYKAKLC